MLFEWRVTVDTSEKMGPKIHWTYLSLEKNDWNLGPLVSRHTHTDFFSLDLRGPFFFFRFKGNKHADDGNHFENVYIELMKHGTLVT